MTRGRQRQVAALLAVMLTLAAACSGDRATGAGPGDTAHTTGSNGSWPGAPKNVATVDYGKPGPYKIGTTRVPVGDTHAVVYYPADPDGLDHLVHVTAYSSGDAFSLELRAPIATLVPELVADIPIDAYRDARVNREGPFPVIVHSHGFAGFNLFGSRHFSLLASWGFVVAAPQHLSRDLAAVTGGRVVTTGDPDVADLKGTLDVLQKANATPGHPLAKGLDTEMVGTEGHSVGGRASYLFAATDRRVKVWVGQAPSAPVPFEPGDEVLTPEELQARQTAALASAPALGKPSMIVAAEKDSVIPLAGVVAEYDWLTAPKRMEIVRNAGHAGFLDTCRPIREQGGLQKYAEQLPLFAWLFRLAGDGCGPDNVDPVRAAAFIDHVTIAHYRLAFGKDRTDASLTSEYLEKAFPEAFGGQQRR